jgi:tetratricopeptide (TPR) repeat protein
LADYDTFLRYTAPASGTTATAATSVASLSTDPAEQAAAAFDRKDYAAAETGFTAALTKAKSAKLYYDRAAARAAMGKLDAAQTDLSSALALDPKDPFVNFALGRIALKRGDLAEASRRFADAQGAAAQSNDMAERIWKTYEAAHHYAEAIPYADRIAATASGGQKAAALNASCWLRAEGGLDLDRALADCNQALTLAPKTPAMLDSRALVELRLARTEQALADYDAALAAGAVEPTSLFGRSLAERRLGRTAEADRDAERARQIDATVAQDFAAWRVTR